MAKKKVRDYHEPWSAASSPKDTRPCPLVLSEHIDQDMINTWYADRDRRERAAHWFVRAARMHPPDITFDAGTFKIGHGDGIIAFTRNLGDDESSLTHQEACERACDCVNACKAIADPVKLIEDVRGLLFDMVRGEAGPSDPRIISCLGRLIPAEQLKQFEEDQ